MKKEKNYVDFGEWMQKLRTEKNLTEAEVVEKLGISDITEKTVKRWERDLEFPDLNTIYKISELYFVPSEELIKSKEDTLKSGVNGINKRFIRWLSMLLGISMYGTIILCRIIVYIALIATLIWFFCVLKEFLN